MSDTLLPDFPTVEELGNWLLQYEILDRIHVGRESAIYWARQPALDRHVMIRVMAEPEADAVPRLLERLRQRARLVHPNIVGVFDFGRTHAGALYLITEHVDGCMMDALVRERQITPKHAYALALQLCDTLQIIHDHHTVHGALSVRTLLVTRDWQIKITGIGMVEAADGEMSWLEESSATYADDIHALGVVLHEMFGKEPLGADGRVSRDLPPAFAAVIRLCLEPDLTKHYQRPAEVREALTHALRAEKQAAVPPAPVAAREVAAVQAAPLAPPPRYAPGSPPPLVRRAQPSLARKIDDFLWALLRTSLHLAIFGITAAGILVLVLLKDRLVIEEVETDTGKDMREEPAFPASEVLGTMPPPAVLTPPPVQKSLTLPTPADPLAELNAQYVGSVQKEAAAALEGVRLNEMPFLQRELKRLQESPGVPDTDEPDLPDSLKRLREDYRRRRAELGR